MSFCVCFHDGRASLLLPWKVCSTRFFVHVATIRHPRVCQINGSHQISVVTPASAHNWLCSFPLSCSFPTTLTPKRAHQPTAQIRHLTFSPETTIVQNSFLTPCANLCTEQQQELPGELPNKYLWPEILLWTEIVTQDPSTSWAYFWEKIWTSSQHSLPLFISLLTTLITANLKANCQQTKPLRLSSSFA